MLGLAREAGAPDEAKRHGFTLAEILVALMILATMAAVTVPVVLGRVRAANTAAVASELQTLRDAIVNYKQHVGRYPNKLQYLNVLLTSAVYDPCSIAYTSVNYGAWRGPYVTRPILARYVIADADTVENVLTRSGPPTANQNNYLQITVSGVDSVMANDLEAQLDNGNWSTGAITWAQINGPYGKLKYQIPIAGNSTSGC